MSTKINVRSPYYLSYSEPVKPLPEFSCAYANPQGFLVDDSGVISEPNLDFGAIKDYTSTAGDFNNGKFDEVSSDTLRTVTYTIEAPEGFSNAGDAIHCSVEATQEAKPVSCPAVVSPSSTISNQALNVGGNSVDVDYSSKFTGTTSDFTDIVRNTHQEYLDTSINQTAETITITSKNTAGSFDIYVERIDNITGCTAAQKITVVVSVVAAFDCTAANLLGGNVASDGTLTKPSSIGEITATKETSGGASVTSIAANNTGSDISVTLFYDITVPDGYSNTGNTIECNKTYTQRSNTVVPTFTCDDVDFDDQAILTNGNVTAGIAQWHQAPLGKSDPNFLLTINSFTPTTFPSVTTKTNRSVDYTVTVPTGFTNSGNTITCTETLKQPPSILDTGACSDWQYSFFGGRILYPVRNRQGRIIYSIPKPYDEFFEKNHKAIGAGGIVFKSRVSDFEDMVGERILVNCSTFNAANGYHMFVSKTSRPAETDTEIVLVFQGAQGVVTAVYRKDWVTERLYKIG